MILVFSGSRTFIDYDRAKKYIGKGLRELDIEVNDIELVIQGGARGFDELAAKWAGKMDIACRTEYAHWDDLHKDAVVKQGQYGPYNALAGHERNARMADEGDAVLCVWDGKSKGTWQMYSYCVKHNIPVAIIKGQP